MSQQKIQKLITSYHNSIKEIRTLGEILPELIEETSKLINQSNVLDVIQSCWEVYILSCNDSRNFKLVLLGMEGAKLCLEYEKKYSSTTMYSQAIMTNTIEQLLNQLGQIKLREGITSFFEFLINLYSSNSSQNRSDLLTITSFLEKIWSMKYGEHKNTKIRSGVSIKFQS